MQNQSYFVNIYLQPDENTSEIVSALNKLDDSSNYNNTNKKFIPHSTIVMKVLEKEEIESIKNEIEKLDFDGLELEVDRYYCEKGGGFIWTGVYLKGNEKLKKLKIDILNITKKFKNRNRDINSYAISNYFEENELPIKLEEDINLDSLHMTFGGKDIKDEFEKTNFTKKIKFEKIGIGIMGNYGSVREKLYII